MARIESNRGARRSLLRLNRPGDLFSPTPLLRKLLVGNVITFLIGTLLFALTFDPNAYEVEKSVLRRYFEAMTMILLVSNAIVLLSHLGAVLVSRYAGNRTGFLRGALLASTWVLSGGLVFGLTLFLGISRVNFDGVSPLAGALLAMATLGVLSALVGVCVLFVKSARQSFRRRKELISQGDMLAAEFQAAQSVQRSLLPSENIRLHGFDISGTTEPAVEVGGDYFDYLTFADGSKGIIVADAAGKGIPAALMMAKFQGMAQALSIHIDNATDFFVGLNDTLRIRLDRHNFITVGMLTIDFEDRCSFYRAGHNPLLVYRAASATIETCRPGGMALGLTHGAMLSASLKPDEFAMQSGDVALLFSDGLTEALDTSGNEYDDHRVAASLSAAAGRGLSAAGIRESLLTDLAAFVGSAAPHDDITVVVVKKI